MAADESDLSFDARTSTRLRRMGEQALDARTSAEPDPTADRVPRETAPELTPVDAMAVHLLLSGGSVVDWRRLYYRSRDEVVGFLEINGFDIDEPGELARLHELHRRAVAYVEETFDIDIPPRVRRAQDPCELFLAASGDNHWEQRAACVVLKAMHVINHLEARRLIHYLSVSERNLFAAAASRVDDFVARMRAAGLDIVRYEPSTKSEHSLITKLISKPRVTAAQIFDKLRFRMVTRHRDELVPVMHWLVKHLFPFNHVITGESHNTILTTDEINAQIHGQLDPEAPRPTERAPGVPAEENPATSSNFRMINFVVELPVRTSALVSREERARFEHLGHLVLVTLEFQLFDEATARANEAGEGSHAAYKERQLRVVGRRLWGDTPPPLRRPPTEPEGSGRG